MFCPSCGTANQAGQFCSKCGSALNASTASPAMTPQAQQVVQPTSAAASSGFSTASIVLGAVAFFFLPWLFGTMGIVFGAIAVSRKQPRAAVGLTMSILGLVLGSIIGAIVGMGMYT